MSLVLNSSKLTDTVTTWNEEMLARLKISKIAFDINSRQWCFCIQGSKYVGHTAVAAGWGMWESTLISVHQHLLFIIRFSILFLFPPFLLFECTAFGIFGRCWHPVLTPTYLFYQKKLTIQKNLNRFIPTFYTVNYRSLSLTSISKTNLFISSSPIPVTFSISSS